MELGLEFVEVTQRNGKETLRWGSKNNGSSALKRELYWAGSPLGFRLPVRGGVKEALSSPANSIPFVWVSSRSTSGFQCPARLKGE